MAKVKCNEFDCKYNYCEACMKKSIEVTKDAKCDSFDTKHDGSPIDMEFGLEEDFFSNQDSKEVRCKCVSCKTNNNGCCTREHLHVADINDVAKCSSYQKR
jgi:hypothetical protein